MQNDYRVISREYPTKMTESTTVPALLCRDVKQTKRRFNCVNGNIFSTAGTEIRVPIAGNFVLGAHNTNVNFKLLFTGTGDCVADFSWHAMFSQIRVEAGSGSSIILEQIDDPGVLAAFVGQYTFTQEDASRENARALGMEDQAAIATGVITKSGTIITAGATDASEIALDLSLVLGLFTTSLPLYETGGLTVVFTLNQFNACGVFAATATALTSIKDIYITANCLEGGEKYEKDLRDAKTKNGEVSVMFNTVRRYIQSVAQGSASGGTQLLINDRAKSCLGFVAVGRASGDLLAPLKYKNSSSTFEAWNNHNYNIAGQMYPMAGINTISEAIDENLDTMQHLSKRKESGGLLARIQANPKAVYDASATGQSGILCVNLSKCSANEDVWGKGLNLSGSNLSNYLQVAYTPAAAQTVNIYSIFQMKVHIDKMGNFTTEY